MVFESINKKVISIIDCNNFYVSCERVFNPKLVGMPVIVLSNNDGCAVARSNEAKSLGIKMGQPYFEIKKLCDKNNVFVYSSNYSLYSDMSSRVMSELKKFASEIEIYSIDEAFLDLSNMHIKDYFKYGNELKTYIFRATGIPISIGIGTTKTLAKAVNKIAKKSSYGVLSSIGLSEHQMDDLLKQLDVGDLWGVGRRYNYLLNSNGIYKAKDLKYADIRWVEKKMTIQGERTVLELNGVCCYPLSSINPGKKAIASTRSFGRPVTSKSEIAQALSTYTGIAGEKLRRQKSVARNLCVFIHTSLFNREESHYYNSIMLHFEATSYQPDLVKYALSGLDKIYKDGFRYKKAGVILTNIEPSNHQQLTLFSNYKLEREVKTKQKNLMRVFDSVNSKWGRETMKLGTQGFKKDWYMKQERKSNRFTTSLQELLVVNV